LGGNEKLKIKNEKFDEKSSFWQEGHLFKTTEGILIRFDFWFVIFICPF
jgi:hypothetical protein